MSAIGGVLHIGVGNAHKNKNCSRIELHRFVLGMALLEELRPSRILGVVRIGVGVVRTENCRRTELLRIGRVRASSEKRCPSTLLKVLQIGIRDVHMP